MTTTDTAVPDRLLSVQQAAEILSCHQMTVYRMIAAGRLPAVRVGPRLLRIPAKALYALGRPVVEKP